MSDNRDSFIFYRSFQEAINGLTESDQLIIYRAIANYALDKEMPELDGFAKVVFALIKPQLDANWKRFENGRKGAEHGLKGGAPKGNKNAKKNETTPNQPQNNGKTTPNNNVNVFNVNDNLNANIDNREKASRFLPPTINEIKDYCKERNNSIDPQKFFDFYTAKNWMIGKNKMKDWRAAVRTWEKSDKQNNSSNKPNIANHDNTRKYERF